LALRKSLNVNDLIFQTVEDGLDAYLRSVPELLSRSGKKLRRTMKDNALASAALQRLLETGRRASHIAFGCSPGYKKVVMGYAPEGAL
jgi:hypothetical protein